MMSSEHGRHGKSATPPDAGGGTPETGDHALHFPPDQAMTSRSGDTENAMAGMPGHEGMAAGGGGDMGG